MFLAQQLRIDTVSREKGLLFKNLYILEELLSIVFSQKSTLCRFSFVPFQILKDHPFEGVPPPDSSWPCWESEDEVNLPLKINSVNYLEQLEFLSLFIKCFPVYKQIIENTCVMCLDSSAVQLWLFVSQV